MDQFWAIVVAIVPSIGVGFLFYKVMRAIIEGDRNERLAHSRWEAEQDRLAAQNVSAASEPVIDELSSARGPEGHAK